MRSWLDGLFFSNLFIALGAAVATEQTYLQLGLGWHWDLLTLCVGAATFAHYNFQRLFSIRVIKRETLTPATIWLVRNARAITVVSILALGVAAISFLQLSREVWFPVVLIVIVSGLYAVPVGGIRLREVGLLKLFLIALIWGLVTVTLPVHHVGMKVLDTQHLWLLAERVAFIAALTLPFDLRDILIDRAYNLKTIPALIGRKATHRLCFVLLIGMVLFEWLRQLNSDTPGYPILIPLVLSALISSICIANQQRWEGRYYYLGILDGMIILQGLLVGLALLIA